MQTAVIARAVCLSFCLMSVPNVPVFVWKNEHTIVQSSASGRTVILASEEVKIIWRSLQRGRYSEALPVASENLTNNRI